MSLSRICEPLFQYVCRLNRSARKGGTFEVGILRNDIDGVFDKMKSSAAAANLSEQLEKVTMPLVFFVDSMIAESELSIAVEWNKNRLAYEKNELAGDEKFFDLLDETLADATESATERLVIFYTCIGIGFTGWYAGQPEYLEKKMKEISGRIRNHMQADGGSVVCPAAYEHVDGRDLIEPPGHKLMGIAIALVGLIIVLFVTNTYLYREASRDVAKALRRIILSEKVLSEEKAVTNEQE